MRKRLYLHIGQTKTGSTALQLHLHRHREALSRQGLLYPEVPAGARLKTQHRFLVDALHEAGDQPARAGDVWMPFLDQLRQAPEPGVVLSEEVFWHLFEQRPTLRRRALGWVAEVLQDFDVRVVCYLRRQDLWVESWFNQVAKSRVPLPMASLTFDDFVQRHRELGLFDYAARVAEWSEPFGQGAIVLRVHEPGRLVGDSVVDDFAEVIGARLPPLTAGQRAQPRLSPAACHFANLFARLPGSGAHRAAFLHAIRDLGDAGDQRRLLAPDAAAWLVERYRPGNSGLARTYLGREELFACPQRAHTVYPGPSTDDLAELGMRLFMALAGAVPRGDGAD
ncbi:hypothetical protein [Ideonella sp.]|uniref:hypothetical protein n=1 Tax=Ideonella sp. TaxID=1929293 RepID=UPI0035B28577